MGYSVKYKVTNTGYVPIGVYDKDGTLIVLKPSESTILDYKITVTSSLAVEPIEEDDGETKEDQIESYPKKRRKMEVND